MSDFKAQADPYFNPYEAPKGDLKPIGSLADGGLWRDGNLLVMRKDALLPDRCLRCDSPAEGYRLKRNLSWHHPAWYLIVLANLLIYVIVALCIRKTAKIEVPLCPIHRAKRRNAILTGWLLALAGIGLFIAGIALGGTERESSLIVLVPVGAVVFLVGLFWGAIGAPPVVPTRIDDYYVWLKKVGPEFLGHLPVWPGPP